RLHPRRGQLQPRTGPARRALPGAQARPAVVVPRQPGGHAPLPRARDRDRRVLQHRRLQRRHPRVPVDPRAARRRPADGLLVPRPPRRRAPPRRGRGARARRGPRLQPRQGGVQAVTRRLSSALLDDLDPSVERPRYAREELAEGVVHLGLGAFHRAHQAAFLDEIAARGDMRWGIVGVSLRSPAVRDALAPQDNLYTLVERDAAGERTRIMAPLKRVLVAPEAPGAVVGAMAQPSVRIVTLTVTEKGYGIARDRGGLDISDPGIAADLRNLGRPRTAVGFLVAALYARRDVGLPPFTAISCDNLPSNGTLLREAVLELAAARDRSLAAWVADYGAFPNSMVDRIVPATTAEALEAHAARYG